MDFEIEDISLFREPRYNRVGYMTCVRFIQRHVWPFPIYQALFIFAFGGYIEEYGDWSYLQEIKSRIYNLNSLFLPALGVSADKILLSMEIGLILLTVAVWLRRSLLRRALTFTRWIYYLDGKEDKSLWAYLWRFALFIGMGRNPGTFNNDVILPTLPLPSISATAQRLLESVQVHFKDRPDEYKSCEDNFKKFTKEYGSAAQRRLWVKSWLGGNHATAWWKAVAFTSNRSSMLLNGSFFGFERREKVPTNNQLARAAVVLYLFGNMRTLMLGGKINPQWFQGRVPLCMDQWKNIFASTRLLKEGHDDLWSYPPSYSQHVVVLHRGHFYKLSLFSAWRMIISPARIQSQLEWIVEDSLSRSDEDKEYLNNLPLITNVARNTWFEVHQKHFSDGDNVNFLEEIKRAICFVSLNELTPSTEADEDALMAMTGFQGQLWMDKSVNFVFFQNGRMGTYVDQAAVDPAVFSTCLERLCQSDTEDMYIDGDAKDISGCATDSEFPLYMQWDYDAPLRKSLKAAQKFYAHKSKLASVSTLKFTGYGRSVVKANGLSRDAFIQCVLHIAFHRVTGWIPFSAESVPTRLYSEGRTDIIRPLTPEMMSFIREFSKMHHGKYEEGIVSLFKLASRRHQWQIRHVMTGKGIDRHLVCLSVAVQVKTYRRCKPLEDIINIPFDMYSYRLTHSSEKNFWLLGLTNKNALTVSYKTLSDPEAFAFCVTTFGNDKQIDATAFVRKLEETLNDIGELFSM